MAAVAVSYMVVLGVLVPVIARIIAAVSQMVEVFVVYLVVFTAAWIWFRRLRRDGWGETKLIYEDLEETVADLGIRDLGYAKQQIRPGPSANS